MQLMLLFSVHVFFSRGGGDLVINLDQIIYAGFFYKIVFKKNQCECVVVVYYIVLTNMIKNKYVKIHIF